jgi:hypothetical protein
MNLPYESIPVLPLPHHQTIFSRSGVPRLRDATLVNANIVEQTSASLAVHHASPIAPLRERDAVALEEFFNYERIHEIVLDIHRCLARMYPEPCWEDEPYEFLRGYI